MDTGPIILTEQGSRVFWAYDAWHEHCIKNNIADPWKMEEKIRDEYSKFEEYIDENGYKAWHLNYETPTEDQVRRLKECHEYRDEYMIAREEWVANYLFKNFGYNALTTFAQTHLSEESRNKIFKRIYPCEGAEKQCNFACPIFNNCPYQKQGIYRSGVDYSSKWEGD